jgi:hypothetical protein
MEVRMTQKGLVSALLFVSLMAAGPVAAQFLAADLIYLPAVAHTNGEDESRWRSDVYITNVEEDVDIDIAIVYLQTGGVSNAGAFEDREFWVGGREEDGFGIIDEELADIPPNGTVVIRDPVGQYWAEFEGFAESGALVIFAYEADSLEDDGTRVYKNAIVNSRVYTPFTFFLPDTENEGEFEQRTGTYGQTLPGVAWYNLADPSAVDEDRNFSFQLLTGAGENPLFRYNVGLVNASDPLTTLTAWIQPFDGNGEPLLDDQDDPLIQVVLMPPNSHIQYNSIFSSRFGLDEVPINTILKITVISWTSGSSEPVVGMTVYGNYIDNRSQDPTAILPAFGFPYNVECQWPPNDAKSSGTGPFPLVSRRPVEIPSR